MKNAKRTNKLHAYCKAKLLSLIKENDPTLTDKQLASFSAMLDDPKIDNTRKLPIYLDDEEFAYWYAYRNNPNDLERLIQKFRARTFPAYYKPQIRKYKMLASMTAEVLAEINQFKKANRQKYASSAKLIVKNTNRQTDWLAELALSGDEFQKLLAVDAMCVRGLVITGAKHKAYNAASFGFNKYKSKSFKNPIHYYFRSADVEEIRKMLIEKYGEDEFNLRMRFVEDPFEGGIRICYHNYVVNASTGNLVRHFYIIDNRCFEKVYAKLSIEWQAKLMKLLLKDVADDASMDYISDSTKTELMSSQKSEILSEIVSDADVKSALFQLALEIAIGDPSNPLVDEIQKLAA